MKKKKHKELETNLSEWGDFNDTLYAAYSGRLYQRVWDKLYLKLHEKLEPICYEAESEVSDIISYPDYEDYENPTW